MVCGCNCFAVVEDLVLKLPVYRTGYDMYSSTAARSAEV